METGPYKEFDSKPRNSRFLAILFTTVTIVLCLLIGLGTWILLSQSEKSIPVERTKNVIEEIVIVEPTVAEPQIKFETPSEIDFKEGRSDIVDNVILAEVQETIKQEEEQKEESVGIFNPIESPFLQSLAELGNNVASEIFSKFAEHEYFSSLFDSSDEEGTDDHSRTRRSIVDSVGLSVFKYLNYLSFGRFMFNEVYSITEYAVEGRKLSGDADAMFLDNGYFLAPEMEENLNNIEKSDTAVEATSARPNRPPSAYDDGWTPMVNKVSLKFITNMLTTLLNLMREYLMKDDVMECLWFMFCKDMNHQAKYKDPMGYLARVNSVGLEVLVDKEGREQDTINRVWRALTQWEPLDCGPMFPRCDGSKALEIVNEVANASRR